jgi:hypothetical protein
VLKKRTSLALAVACLAVAACKETRKGAITLAGPSNIPLIDKSGSHAELVAGPAEITIQKGDRKGTLAIGVKQDGRPDVNIVAPFNGNPADGNFTLRGADIGQPVDMASSRGYVITGPTVRWTEWENMGNARCLVETSYDPCDENWTVAFSAAGSALGSFAARTASECNQQRFERFCQQDPRIPMPEPHGPRRLSETLSQDPSQVKFE